jgi:hypothetical protein
MSSMGSVLGDVFLLLGIVVSSVKGHYSAAAIKPIWRPNYGVAVLAALHALRDECASSVSARPCRAHAISYVLSARVMRGAGPSFPRKGLAPTSLIARLRCSLVASDR